MNPRAGVDLADLPLLPRWLQLAVGGGLVLIGVLIAVGMVWGGW